MSNEIDVANDTMVTTLDSISSGDAALDTVQKHVITLINGSWKLDWSRSEKAYDFFSALGVPFLLRPLLALADTMTPTYHLLLTADEFTIRGGITPSVDRFFFKSSSFWGSPDGSKHPAVITAHHDCLIIYVTHTVKLIDIKMTKKIVSGELLMIFELIDRVTRHVEQTFKRTYKRISGGGGGA
jgi:hypothetical protein